MGGRTTKAVLPTEQEKRDEKTRAGVLEPMRKQFAPLPKKWTKKLEKLEKLESNFEKDRRVTRQRKRLVHKDSTPWTSATIAT
jgi:hypothetical protein